MSAILCPFLLAIPTRHVISGGATMEPDYGDDRKANPRACVGSRCAKWVPEILSTSSISGSRRVGLRREGVGDEFVRIDHNGNPDSVPGSPSGRGWCADNLRRAPFADPAAPPAVA